MFKKALLTASLLMLTAFPVYAEIQPGMHLLELNVVNQSSLQEAERTKPVTRNELYIWLDRLTKSVTVKPVTKGFKDIAPNSNFAQVASKAVTLNLLLPDQSSGKFNPAKKVTTEEMCYVMLKLLKEDADLTQVLYQGCEAGLLEGMKVTKANEPLTKKQAYTILENALKSKVAGSQLNLESYLEEAAKNKAVDLSEVKAVEVPSIPKETVAKEETVTSTYTSVAKYMKVISDSKILVTYDRVPMEKQIKAFKVTGKNGSELHSISTEIVNQTTIVYQMNLPLQANVMYVSNESPVMQLIYEAADRFTPYVISQQCQAMHTSAIKVVFNKNMDINSTLNIKNYQVTGDIKIQQVRFGITEDNQLDLKTVILETTQQTPGKFYNLIVDSSIKDAYGNMLSTGRGLTSISIYGASYDITGPKVAKATPRSIDTVAVYFDEISEIDTVTATNIGNYSVYDVVSKKSFAIKSASMEMNKSTGKQNVVVLTIDSLDRNNRYMVEVRNVKDIQQNAIPNDTDFRASFALTEKEEKGPEMANVEAISRNLLKVTFDKEIRVYDDFSLDDIQLRDEIKATKVEIDHSNERILWIWTTDHTKSNISLLRIKNVYDSFGNGSNSRWTQTYYSAIITESQGPLVSLVENNISAGDNVIHVYFNKEMDKRTLLDTNNYSIKNLKVLYVYSSRNNEVYIVTEKQKRALPYEVSLMNLKDALDSTLQSSSAKQIVIGYSLD